MIQKHRTRNDSTYDKLYRFIIEYIQTHGYAPTVQEMADGIHLKSKSTVHGYLKDLFTSGAIETDNPGAPRAIRVPGYRFIKENARGGITPGQKNHERTDNNAS